MVPPDSHQAGRLLSTYGQIVGLWGGDYAAAMEALGQALAIARREGDVALEMRTLAESSNVNAFHHRFPECLEDNLKAIELSLHIDVPQVEVAQGAVHDIVALREHDIEKEESEDL